MNGKRESRKVIFLEKLPKFRRKQAGAVTQSISPEQAKGVMAAMLVAILLITTMINERLLNDKKSDAVAEMALTHSASRSLASVGDPQVETEVGFTHQIRKDLLNRLQQKRRIAHVGSAPSEFERLVFGFLEGRYLVQLSEGKITNIELGEEAHGARGLDGGPVPVADAAAFISLHRSLMPVFFERVDLKKRSRVQHLTQEVYELIGDDADVKASVVVHLDQAQGLVSMKVITPGELEESEHAALADTN